MTRLKNIMAGGGSSGGSAGSAGAGSSRDVKPQFQADVKPNIGGSSSVGGGASLGFVPHRRHAKVIIHNLSSDAGTKYNFSTAVIAEPAAPGRERCTCPARIKRTEAAEGGMA
jgi:hypothetical protein